MPASPGRHRVLWTAGYESTFRVVQLLRVGRTVEPYYVVSETRLSRAYEVRQMEHIRGLLGSKDGVDTDLLLPTVLVDASELPPMLAVSAAWDRLTLRYRLGEQYEWLARFALSSDEGPFELGLVGSAPGSQELWASSRQRDQEFPDNVWELDDEPSVPDLRIFAGFVFPLFGWTKQEIEQVTGTWGFQDVMEATWFCHWPTLAGEPCGICAACRTTAEEGLALRVPGREQARSSDSVPTAGAVPAPSPSGTEPADNGEQKPFTAPRDSRGVAARLTPIASPVVSRIPRVKRLERRVAALDRELRNRERQLAKWRGKLAETRTELRETRAALRDLRRERQIAIRLGEHPSFDHYIKFQRHETDALKALGLTDPIWFTNNKTAAAQLAQEEGARTPTAYQTVDDIEELDWRQLPERVVVKANEGKSAEGVFLLFREGKKWLSLLDGEVLSNRQISERFRRHRETLPDPDGALYVAEEMICRPDGSGRPSYDWKFFLIGGKIELILQKDGTAGRTTEAQKYRLLDRRFEELGPVRLHGTHDPSLPHPDNPEHLWVTAERLGRRLDRPLIRVDLLEDDRGVVFGEFTPIPGGNHWYGPTVDRALGEMAVAAHAGYLARQRNDLVPAPENLYQH